MRYRRYKAMKAMQPMHHRQGFTLIEAAVATMIVGVGILALVHAMASGTRVNQQGRNVTQAVFLAQEIREWTIRLPFNDPDPADAGKPPGSDGTNPQTFVDDLDDLMDVTYTPPRNANGQPINDLTGWSQTIQLQWKDPNSLLMTVPNGSSDAILVTVIIRRNAVEVLRTSWIVCRRS
jgi:prepilin-type N-terminal cleavage/methylation domain-containing protein